jgi:hypothetical protein
VLLHDVRSSQKTGKNFLVEHGFVTHRRHVGSLK